MQHLHFDKTLKTFLVTFTTHRIITFMVESPNCHLFLYILLDSKIITDPVNSKVRWF